MLFVEWHLFNAICEYIFKYSSYSRGTFAAQSAAGFRQGTRIAGITRVTERGCRRARERAVENVRFENWVSVASATATGILIGPWQPRPVQTGKAPANRLFVPGEKDTHLIEYKADPLYHCYCAGTCLLPMQSSFRSSTTMHLNCTSSQL